MKTDYNSGKKESVIPEKRRKFDSNSPIVAPSNENGNGKEESGATSTSFSKPQPKKWCVNKPFKLFKLGVKYNCIKTKKANPDFLIFENAENPQPSTSFSTCSNIESVSNDKCKDDTRKVPKQKDKKQEEDDDWYHQLEMDKEYEEN